MVNRHRIIFLILLIAVVITINFIITQISKQKYGFKKAASERQCIASSGFSDVVCNNEYWQVVHSEGKTFYMFGAYLDRRADQNNVKILGMLKGEHPVELYCKFWTGNSNLTIAKVDTFLYIWIDQWGNSPGQLKPYIVSCPYNKDYPPDGVTLLAEKEAEAVTNMLEIKYNHSGRKKDFAVCVKGLNHLEDISLRLVEWIELVNLLGANKIYFYVFHAHKNVMQVLQYYTKMNVIEYRMITLPANLSNDVEERNEYLSKNVVQKRRHELIPYNDCFYKHQQEFQHFVLMDIDEVIVPIEGNWDDLTTLIKRDNASYSSYEARNVYFLDEFTKTLQPEIPRYMHILQHVYRSSVYSKLGYYVKSFFVPERVLLLHNHVPLKCINGECMRYVINTTDAQLQHYRKDCSDRTDCDAHGNLTVRDDRLLRFKDDLVRRVSNTVKALNLE